MIMPALVCSAQNCVYNNAMYCSRDDIKIDGESAKVCQDTCCQSFEERKHDNMRSSMGSPSIETGIDCEAVHCKHNEECRCHAEHVDISGAAAKRCNETECVTFDQK